MQQITHLPGSANVGPHVLPAARPSGRLTIFSAAERRFCKPLLRGFGEQQPSVEIDFVFGISTELHSRYLEEAKARSVTASLIWSSAMDSQAQLVLDGHAQPLGLTESSPPWAIFADLAVATTCEPLFTLSRDASATAGTAAEVTRLLRREPAHYRRRIVLPDIERNGLGFLAMLHCSLHDPDFDDFLHALEKCEPQAVGSMRGLTETVAEGALLGLHVLGTYALQATATNSALHIAQSSQPSIAVSRVAFIPRHAPNVDAARAFLSYMLSPQGQELIAQGGLVPLGAPQIRDVAPIPLGECFTHLVDPTKRARLLARWRTAVRRLDL